jgi:DNA adenine methylase
MGDFKHPSMPSAEHLATVSVVLQGCRLECRRFPEVLAECGEGDVVYCDPPYCETFSDYVAGGFGLAHHVLLASLARKAAERGARVLGSNSDSDQTRKVYKKFRIVDDPVVKYHIGPLARHRRNEKELILTPDM